MADKKTTTQAAEQAALDPPAAVRNDIPLLTEKDIECRVQSVSRAKTGRVGAVLLLYKDARVDMRILDQVFGPGNWQRTHEVINGNLFCNIDIWDAENRQRKRPGVRRLQARRLQRGDRPRTLHRPLHLCRTGRQRVLFRRPERTEGSPEMLFEHPLHRRPRRL